MTVKKTLLIGLQNETTSPNRFHTLKIQRIPLRVMQNRHREEILSRRHLNCDDFVLLSEKFAGF